MSHSESVQPTSQPAKPVPDNPTTQNDLVLLMCAHMCADWSALVVSTTTLRHCSVICTGCRFRTALRFVWLCFPIGANMVWHCLICKADLHRVADADSRRRLRSTSTAVLLIPRTRLSIVGDRAFPVATSHAWNNLLPSVTSAPSVYFQKETQNPTFSRHFCWLCY